MNVAKGDIALVLLQTLPAIAGLLLVFLVFATAKLIDLRDSGSASLPDRRAYAELAVWAGTAILVNLVGTVGIWGWAVGWWSGFGVVTVLFVLSLVSVAALTVLSLTRSGALELLLKRPPRQ